MVMWRARCHVVDLARHLKPGSESLERIMSLGEPNARLQMIIWTSRGSLAHDMKNLLVSECAVLSSMTAKESE